MLEPVDKPSAFYNQAVRLPDDAADRLLDYMRHYPICSRIVPALGLRETLFKMTGPNYGLWNLHLDKAWDGLQYGFRADGTWDPHHGLRFNPYKFLIDPYAKGIERAMQLDPSMFAYQCTIGDDGKVEGDSWGEMSTLDSLGHCPVSVAIDDRDARKHDGDPEHPHVPWSKTVIYELHVKGFTKNAPWLPEELRGTYAGLAHPTTLAYLQDLGVTSIELLPIMAKQPEVFLQERVRTNYWGYSTLNFFSPEPGYATKKAQQAGAAAVRREVIDMVRALHESGFEVIMDVVYNHTCEGGNAGPSVCWRGLDNLSFYRQQTQHAGELEDTTGCGNTVDFTDTHNITFAVDSLRYWAKRIGIDGFRFDLAVSLARLKGMFTPYHPFLYALRSDQLLGNLKLIMEPWDLGFQGWRTGQFLSPFGEWNDRFRDASRQFWLSDINQTAGHGVTTMQEMATRLCGSADLFATDPGRGATSSINYISAHDGFTLADLTSYDHKHNEANGENNNEPFRQLRRGGPHRRPQHRERTRTFAHEHARHAHSLAWHAHAARRRRIRQHAIRQQQRVLPRQRDRLARLGLDQLHRGNRRIPPTRGHRESDRRAQIARHIQSRGLLHEALPVGAAQAELACAVEPAGWHDAHGFRLARPVGALVHDALVFQGRTRRADCGQRR